MLTNTVEFLPDNEGSDHGWLCIAQAMADFDRPVMVTNYYRVKWCRRSEHDQEIGKTAERDGVGLYRVYMGFGSHLLGLVGGGSALPVLTTETAIPAPKRAKDVRYWCGRWEKWTKSTGWTAAY